MSHKDLLVDATNLFSTVVLHRGLLVDPKPNGSSILEFLPKQDK